MNNIIYAVVRGNYYPHETDSLWQSKLLAEKQAENLEGDWRVSEMMFQDSSNNKNAIPECRDCGIYYCEMGLDLVLPDQQWKVLFPEDEGLLCANCICKRAAKLGGTVVLAWIDNIDYSILEQRQIPAREADR